MLCDICKKKEATVHYTKIIGGEIEELHLCDECSKNHSELEFDSSFSFHKLLAGLIDNIQGEATRKKTEEYSCPFCGLSYTQFRQTGKFGCSKCYETFKSNLIPLFKGIHGHTKHVGKVPKRANENLAKERKIQSLKAEMEKLVAKEAFEEAAIIRDQIRKLEKELGN
ncbi:UvrB/UvrC motif-containing protein [Tepidimicrobium xylanilyticum]|uniref:Protein-arginine kinase activator protein McsA n=1 Tax=Tepidimicrobium xylanilyticum TaxID=1123352 RepID=A0A1H3D6N5_9FIRM|nr:UvrB/UvrC motif-containing protein [Tepidimicrobium xylanilyticum]GMG97906.1 protein-arginine kinase activator protein [Tepidimicrobium xylanilyticum]SDX61404.1 Protein-arginine kinase activator protein McsA [Tepidimicrobium xylanilyticum]